MTMTKRTVYMDYAATTPVDRQVLRAMLPYFAKKFGNSSNLYALGLEAKDAVVGTARKIASALNCRPDEFVFTGSATEADNLAILGVARSVKRQASSIKEPKIIVSNVEHKAVFSACEALKKEGFEIIELPVGKDGLVCPSDLHKLLDNKTILVSVMYANNEIGTIQPISEISKVIREFRKKKIENRSENSTFYSLNSNFYPLFHTDAVQALQYLDCDVNKLGVDLLTISGHKLYGPKGVGGLYVRRGVNIEPIIYGGGQQRGLRPGTENVPAIVGFGEAVKLVTSDKRQETRRIKKLRNKLERGIFKSIPKVVLNGHPTKRLPNFLNISILDIEGEALLLYLDKKGISVNTGSACNSQSLEPSHVLSALGNPYECIHGSVRFTLGKGTTMSDIDYVLRELPPIVARLREISPLNLKLGEVVRQAHHKQKMSEPKAFVGGQTPYFLRNKKQ